MNNDSELQNWRQQWQSGSPSTVDAAAVERLRRGVLRETRWLKLGLVFPVLVTLVVGGDRILRAVRTRETFDVVIAVETWIFILVIWAGCLWIARGTWRPLADNTAAFVDVSIRRREANLRGATFGVSLYVIQLVLLVLALSATLPGGIAAVMTSMTTVIMGWIGVPVAVAALYWFRRRQKASLERLRELKSQLESD